MTLQRTRWLRTGKKQIAKWTTEGAVKCDYHRVFCNVIAYVSSKEYVSILKGACVEREFKVAPRIVYSSLTEEIFCRGLFCCEEEKQAAAKQTLTKLEERG